MTGWLCVLGCVFCAAIQVPLFPSKWSYMVFGYAVGTALEITTDILI